MLETLQRNASAGASSPTPTVEGVLAGWREGLTIINLRCDADDPAVQEAAASVLGFRLPMKACTYEGDVVRAHWAGPDDWFIIGPSGQAEVLLQRLRSALASRHHSVTDVSSGYTVLHMSGASARAILAQACPIDLHPRAFSTGACVGSQFFATSIWLWQTDEAPVYELLVRRSFMGYVWLMVERASSECGLVIRRVL